MSMTWRAISARPYRQTYPAPAAYPQHLLDQFLNLRGVNGVQRDLRVLGSRR